jgi:sulfate transport system ATP-binding protein
MEFLGQVNVFHGRVRNGQALLGDLAFDYPDYIAQRERPATVYMRPHELYIQRSANGAFGLSARVVRVNPAGSVAKVGLKTSDDLDIQVDLSLDRFRELDLSVGEIVFVLPKKARVFLPSEFTD